MSASARPKICPVDGAMLHPRGKGADALHGCFKCNGIWIPAAQLQQLVSAKSGGNTAAPSLRLKEDAAYGGRHRSCPHCRNERLRALHAAGVELDVCPRCHGLWLDAGELDAIVQWHRKQRAVKPMALSQPQSNVADAVLHVVDGADLVVELARILHDSSGATLEFAGEAASAVGEFLFEIAGGILS